MQVCVSFEEGRGESLPEAALGGTQKAVRAAFTLH